MGTSNWQNISYNIELIRKINPESILDIGVGFGRWGFLFREFLEIWNEDNYAGKWKRKIDGIEIFPDYIKEYHNYFYNAIYFGNAADYIKQYDKNYELINCGDVIEHMEKEKALSFIDLCLNKCKYLLINIPIGNNWEQTGSSENEFEAHKSVWYKSDFKKYRYRKIKKFRDYTQRSFIVILLSKDKFKFKNNFRIRYGKYFFIKNFLRNRLLFKSLVNFFENRKKR